MSDQTKTAMKRVRRRRLVTRGVYPWERGRPARRFSRMLPRTAGGTPALPGRNYFDFFEDFFVDFFELFFEVDFFEDFLVDFFELFFDGTLPPSRLASERPMAMACLRLFTFLPEEPLF